MLSKIQRKVRRKKRTGSKIAAKHNVGPILKVRRTNMHAYAQVVDVEKGLTLVSASTLEKAVKTALSNTSNKDAAKYIGSLVATRAQEKGIKSVVFDRSGNPYHGRVRMIAEGAREAGLEF